MCECTNCIDPDCWRRKEGKELDKAIEKIQELEGQQSLPFEKDDEKNGN